MAWAAIPACLKTRFNANEILTSLMLTYVATLLLSTLVHGPWKDPEGYNFPESRLFHDAATLPVADRRARGCIWGVPVRAGARGRRLGGDDAHLIGFQVKVIGAGAARGALRRLQPRGSSGSRC